MQESMTALVNEYGYLGIALLIWIETVFPPIPSEAVLLFGGFLTTRASITPWGAIAAATVGSVGGAAVLYAAGRLIGKERLERLIAGRCGQLLHLSAGDVAKAEAWFEKYEAKAVLFGRCVPIVRSLISIPAGLAGMKPLPFFALTLVGSAVWNTVLVWTGRFAGGAWEQMLQYFGWYSRAVLVAALVLCAAGALYWYKKKRSRSAGEKKEHEA